MAEISIPKPLVSVDWLAQNLGAENLLILDATLPKVLNTQPVEALGMQIPKALYFDLKNSFSANSARFPNTLPAQSQFEAEARNLGVNQTSAIVVYDSYGIYSSPRAWWLFKAFGHSNIAILDGGLPAWKAAGFDLESKHSTVNANGDFCAKKQKDAIVYHKDIDPLSTGGKSNILDARSSDRFQSLVPEPRAGLRSGTIPNSKNLPYQHCLSQGKLKSESELRKLFQPLVSSEERLVFTCGSGITACILDLAASIAGYKNTSVYDGSWTEYGSLNP